MQAGVVTWGQVVERTGDVLNARRHVRSGRWRVLIPGIYATFNGPVPRLTWWWAYLLHAGRDAALAGEAALWLEGVRDRAPDVVEIHVPHSRRVKAAAGSVVVRRRRLEILVHPGRSPSRLRVEVAVLDVADRCARPERVIDVVLAAVQRRLTTPERLVASLRSRRRHRWRTLLEEVLAEADDGVHTPLERRYLLDVERAHGLPRAERNVARPGSESGSTTYPDLWYRRLRVLVELDGIRAHPRESAFRDSARDNRAVAVGDVPLRYGWREVAGDPCAVAAQVAEVLVRQGWTGRPRSCSASCPVGRPMGGEGR